MSQTQRLFTLSLLALWLSCVGDLDYEDIEPRCAAPRFDVPSRDTFCAGRFEPTATVPLADEDRAVGMHSRGGDAAILIAHAPTDSLGALASPTFVSRYSLALAETDQLLSGGVEAVDRLPLITRDLGDAPPLWTPRRLQVVANQGAVVHFLSDRIYLPEQEDEEGAYAQEAVLAHLRSNQDTIQSAVTVQSRTFFSTAVAVDMTSIERPDRLELFYALGPAGLKPLRFTWDAPQQQWREELPALRDNRLLLNTLRDLLAAPPAEEPFVTALSTLCDELHRPHKGDCEAQCRAECVAPNLPICAACRLEYGLFRGLRESNQDPLYGAWAVAADEERGLVLVGQPGRVASFRADELQIKAETFNTIPSPVHALSLVEAAGEPPGAQHVATRLLLEGDQLYILAQDQRVVPLPFYSNANADTLLPAHLLAVTWTADGPDPETLRAVQLPEEFTDTTRVDLAALRDGLLLLRTLQTEEFTYESTTVQRGEDPFWALYDVSGQGAPELLQILDEDAAQEYDRYGMIWDAASGRVMAAEPGRLQAYELESGGAPLR